MWESGDVGVNEGKWRQLNNLGKWRCLGNWGKWQQLDSWGKWGNWVIQRGWCMEANLVTFRNSGSASWENMYSDLPEKIIWAPSSEFVSSSIPSWQILTAHAQPFRGARDLAFCLKVPLDSLLVWASSEGSGETARMRRLAWTFAARIGDKYQIRLTRSICLFLVWFQHLSFGRVRSKYYCLVLFRKNSSVRGHILLCFFGGAHINKFKIIEKCLICFFD